MQMKPYESLETKSNRGATLLEVTIALAIWFILSAGILFVWINTTQGSVRLIDHQSAFENARSSMDALIINIQLAREIRLVTDSNDILQSLTLTQINPQNMPHEYIFTFTYNAPDVSVQFQRLNFSGNEFASGIYSIVIVNENNTRMRITITTGCEEPIVLEGRVDIRFKTIR